MGEVGRGSPYQPGKKTDIESLGKEGMNYPSVQVKKLKYSPGPLNLLQQMKKCTKERAQWAIL